MTTPATEVTDAEQRAMRDAIDRALKASGESGKAGIAAAILQGDRIIFAATQARVPAKYFAFPHLRIEDFQNGEFQFAGGVQEASVLHLYENGDE